MSDTAANAKTLKEIEEREKLAGMTPLDQMQYLANRKVEYLDSKMQQHFPSLQAIKAVNGMILLIADEKKPTMLRLSMPGSWSVLKLK